MEDKVELFELGNQLESAIDTFSLKVVLELLSDIYQEKAHHARASYGEHDAAAYACEEVSKLFRQMGEKEAIEQVF